MAFGGILSQGINPILARSGVAEWLNLLHKTNHVTRKYTVLPGYHTVLLRLMKYVTLSMINVIVCLCKYAAMHGTDAMLVPVPVLCFSQIF